MGSGSGDSSSVSQTQYGIDLVCPVHNDTSWQAQTPDAFDQSLFSIDWQAQKVICPMGNTSLSWITNKSSHGQPAIFVRFSPTDCTPCREQTRCTRSQTAGRELTLIPEHAYLALQEARKRQLQPDFPEKYTRQAGIEGTLSQPICALGLRQTRYIGLPKTHLHHILIAAALNIIRIVSWLDEIPRARTRISHFAALAV